MGIKSQPFVFEKLLHLTTIYWNNKFRKQKKYHVGQGIDFDNFTKQKWNNFDSEKSLRLFKIDITSS